MTYKGDHIVQPAFIISTLSVNNSLNSPAVVRPEKEFLALIKLCEIGSSRRPVEKERPPSLLLNTSSSFVILYKNSVVYI